jgi:hypothetical protein
MLSISGQLHDGIRYDGPSGSADHVSGLPEFVDMSEGSLKSVRAVVLDHPLCGAQSFDIVHLGISPI